MKKMVIFGRLAFAGFLVFAAAGQAQEQNVKKEEMKKIPQTIGRMERKVTVSLDYLLYLPAGYDQQESWPLMIFLHGAGERGSDVNKVRLHGPPKLVDQGKELPFIIVSPQCPEDQWWPGLEKEIIALTDEIMEQYKVDPNGVYLTGLSMGGYGTWAVGCSYPDRFAALVPICGGGRPFRAGSLKDTPIWAFHGQADPVVAVKESQQMVDAVNKAGGHAELTIYPGVEHDSWTQTYANPKLYEWMLSHRKAQDQ